MPSSSRAKPLLRAQSKHYVLSDNPTRHAQYNQPSESLRLEHGVAEHLRERCAGLLEALAYILNAAALRAGRSKSAFLLTEIAGASAWYQHQKGGKRISPAKYRQYRDALCATNAERHALNKHWLDYQLPSQRSDQPPDGALVGGEERPLAVNSALSRRIDIATALAEESTTLRLARPRPHHPLTLGLLDRLRHQSDEPRHLINMLVELGNACNGQAPGAVSLFLANQDKFQHAGAALTQLGPTAWEEVTLAQSVSCLLRFTRSSLSNSDQLFWTKFSERLEHRLADSGEWLYRLGHELPACSAAAPAVWQFQHQRARHFLNALQPRAAHPLIPHDQVDEFLRLGSCVLAAYSYLLQSQLVALTSDTARLLHQVEQGERIIHAIRRLGDNDTTRRFLGMAATDSDRVHTALSTVYRSMANLQLMVARSAGPRERDTILRHTRINIRTAYELLLADRPAWSHGTANTFVSAAAYRFCQGNLRGARHYLAHAAKAYRQTADWFRAALCHDAVAQIEAGPEAVEWTTLILVE